MPFWRRGGAGVSWAAKTDVGRRRDHNEDAVAVVVPEGENAQTEWGFDVALLVCDGVGGGAKGEIASAKTVDLIRRGLSRKDAAPIADRLTAAVASADEAIRTYSTSELDGAQMGTTVVVAVIAGHSATVAHAGDSRAYLARGKTFTQLTPDHSLVAEQVRAGLILAVEAKSHPLRGRITRAVGLGDDARLEISEVPLETNDVLLLCTDGLHGLVADDEILGAIGKDLEKSATKLIEMANERGGTDNVTVALCRID